MLWMMMISLAFAEPCEWILQPQNVEAKRRKITIDGEEYKAKEVAKQLRECDQDEAAEAVELWQTKRKAGVAIMIGSVFLGPVLYVGVFRVSLAIPVVVGGAFLVRSGLKERDLAVELIKEGRAPAEEAQPVADPQPTEGDPVEETTDETTVTLDPSTFSAPDDE